MKPTEAPLRPTQDEISSIRTRKRMRDRRPDPTRPMPLAADALLIQEAFLEQAWRNPAALALHSRHGDCSYGELERISARLAWLLASRGVGAGHTVAILADRTPALVYCLLGVLRAGAAFQIVDAAYPWPRMRACLQQTAPALLLVAGEPPLPEKLSALIAEESQLHVAADARAALAWLAEVAPKAAPPTLQVDARAVAYVSFTSGSTGTPKGIVTGHAPLPHFVAWHIAHGGLTRDDRFSLLSGLSHDPLLRDIFTPLSLGAALCIPEQRTIFDADALFAWFERERISVAHLTPALGEILALGATDERRLDHLRRLYWGGDVLSTGLVARIRSVAPHVEQTNFYGATETPQAMAYFDLKDLGAREAVPVGRGIDLAELLVVREDGQQAELGEVGEIWIRSPYLSRGYLADSQQTAARFVRNPWGDAEHDLCYRTGDLGRYLDDGTVAFAGRADHQLKVRGFRVEPAEITVALERLEAVQRAVVLAHESKGDKQLCGYVVLQRGASASQAELRRALDEQLPSYMVPKHLVVLPEFPLLANGKVDLQALPSPVDELERSGARRRPTNEAQQKLAAIWAEILGLEEVGIDESFLDLGGDSLSAIRALSRMRRLGLPEHVARGIFQGRTIAELTGDGASDSEARPLTGAAKTTLLINVLRGALVLLLVFDHFREGLLQRLRLPSSLLEAIEPVFHVPTPGFAFVFGVGLGYSHYPNYLNNARASRRLLQGGALILLAGTLLMGLSRNAGIAAKGLPLGYHEFSTNFFLPTLYYGLALATAPLWFWLMARREGKWGGSLLAALLLAALCRGCYELARLFLLEHEQLGLLQLGRLMLIARFSYFNLSTGALIGVFCGVFLRRERARSNLAPSLLGLGALLLGVGLACYFVQRGRYPEGLLSSEIWLPEWFFYLGATLLLAALAETLLLLRARALHRGLQWLGVLGQCAMPIFILQGMVFDWSAFGRALGLGHGAATAVAFATFLLAVGWLMRRIHGLYYGTVSSGTAA